MREREERSRYASRSEREEDLARSLDLDSPFLSRFVLFLASERARMSRNWCPSLLPLLTHSLSALHA